MLVAVLAQQGKDGSSKQELALDLLTVHSSAFVNVAFGRAHMDEVWADARKQACRLVKQALLTDVRRVGSTITSLASSGDPGTSSASRSLIHEQVWKNVYEGVVGTDSDAIALLLAVLSQISHIDDLKPVAFEECFKKAKSPAASQAALVAVNNALAVLRNGFRDVLNRYTDLSLGPAAVELLGREDVVKHVVSLMFSPVESLQEAAQGLVALAYDVDGRLDCFRALLEHFPDAALSGINDVLGVYIAYANAVPEACSLSQALARCLTDIIEAMCSSPSSTLR